ncbi:hypothetical protein GASC598I20_000220, partial [Gilliamella apicola SCGC AB-598-I20]
MPNFDTHFLQKLDFHCNFKPLSLHI